MLSSSQATDTPLVSIIVRSMDRPSLARALASIAAQTWPAVEVVLVNAKGAGHSKAADACGRFPLRMAGDGSQLSRSRAANAGLAAASGRWALFLDDDDWIAAEHIQGLAARLLAQPELVAAYSAVSCVERDAATGELRELMRYDVPFDRARLLVENYLPIHSVLFSRDAAAATEGFDPSLPVFEDWDFWIQLAKRGPFAATGACTATYLLGAGDSGLYGNAALQESYARRILAKWQSHIDAAEFESIWLMCRDGLRARDSITREHHIAQAAIDEFGRARDAAVAEAERAHDAARQSQLDAAKARLDAAAAHREASQARYEASQARLDTAAAEGRADAAQRAADSAFEASAEAERLRKEAVESMMRQGEALQIVTREYQTAVALLREEQYTVLRPIARRARRAARTLWSRLPAPVQHAVRKILRRPAPPAAVTPPAVIPGDNTREDWNALLAGGAPDAFTVIVFPVIDWHFRIQRPQHLARELGTQGHRVLYLSTTFAAAGEAPHLRYIESPAENVHLLQLAIEGPVPNLYEDSLSAGQARDLAEALAWLQQAAGLGAFVSLVNLPFWRPVASRLPANTIVYDCMDYHAGFSTNTGTMLGEEEGLLRDCDVLLTTSTRLAQLMQAKAPHKPHALVRNGTQVEHFAHAPAQLRLERDGRPIVGYFGAISEWFDIALVVQAARARPQWRFVLVGSTFGCDVSQARRVPNIEFTGEVPYAELPGWAHAFDVCLIPFLLNELTSCTNPVKVYEYLSAGKPVVATRMPELEAIADQVYLADDADGLVAQVEAALAETHKDAKAVARREWAASHSWKARARQLSDAVAGCLPKVSVVVLCYNNLELTKACLESVERNSLWPSLELIVVDNASSDGTPKWLKAWAATRPWVRAILSERNTGFAAGNNLGLAAATGDILVMLNNDTEVSPGWLHGLHRHFEQDARLGLVGPVTDNIGNEAKIEVGYSDRADMPAWAAAHAARHAGERMQSRVLAFFCVAMRRQVYAQVGGLDESFGLGFFEDDDYCNRVRQAGWELAIAEDVFVHHHLSASFDKLKSSTRQALFEKNKAIYESKWGPWVPHRYREAETAE